MSGAARSRRQSILSWVFGVLAATIVLAGASVFAWGMAAGSGPEYHRVLIGLIVVGLPTIILTLFFATLAFIVSQPKVSAGRMARRVLLAFVGAFFTPVGLVAAPSFLWIVGAGAFYLLWRDIRAGNEAPSRG